MEFLFLATPQLYQTVPRAGLDILPLQIGTPHPQRRFLPQQEQLMPLAPFTLFTQLHIELPQQSRKDQSHLHVRKVPTKSQYIFMKRISDAVGIIYLPIRFLGP